MSFVSYSQNFEDVMLYRALKNVSKGFYIDVGANDPIVDSVTKAFYDRGWRGVNIDPSLKAFASLSAMRPRDVNLNLAVGDADRELLFYDVSVSGWSTLDANVAKKHKDDGIAVSERVVSVKKLLDICEEYAKGEIHFLKVDVEGAEELVFSGMEFLKFRPWIVVVEATLPNSSTLNYASWEPKILDGGYEFVYFDGLNRFYTAKERYELKKSFLIPPNVFDDYVLYEIYALREQIEEEKQNAKLAALEAEVKIHEARTSEHLAHVSAHEAHVSAHEAHVSANEAHVQLKGVYGSKSWKLTAPLRFLAKLKRIRTKAELKELIKEVIVRIARNQKLKSFIKSILSSFPYLEKKVRALYFRANPNAVPPDEQRQSGFEAELHLSSKERKIKSELQNLLKQKEESQCE